MLKSDGADRAFCERWIWFTAVLNGMITQYMLGMYALFPHSITLEPKTLIEPGLMLINSLLFFPLTYYWTYKHRSNAWLILCLIFGPLAMLFFAYQQWGKETDALGQAIFLAGFALNALFYIPWYAMSLKVIQIHNRDKARSV